MPTAKTTQSTAKTTPKKRPTRSAAARKPATGRKTSAMSKREYADLRKAANKVELEAGRMAGRTSLLLERVAKDLDKSYHKSDAAKVVKQLEKQIAAWGRVAERELKKVEKALAAEFATVSKGFKEATAEVTKTAGKPVAKKTTSRQKTTSPRKPGAKKSTAKRTPAKRTPARRTTTRKTTARKTTR